MVEYDESATCWHIMTVTRGGTVSLLRNLDAPTARGVYRQLRPDEWPTEYIGLPKLSDPDFAGSFSWPGTVRSVRDGDIERVEVLGPDGASLDPWRGVEKRVIDMTDEVERQRAYRRSKMGMVDSYGNAS